MDILKLALKAQSDSSNNDTRIFQSKRPFEWHKEKVKQKSSKEAMQSNFSSRSRIFLSTLLLVPLLSACSLFSEIKKVYEHEQAIELYNSTVDDLNAHKYKEVYPVLLKAEQLDPEDSHICWGLGKTLVGLGKTEAGLKYLQKSWAKDKSSPQTLLSLGNAYQESGEFSRAADCFDDYLKLCPQDKSQDLPELSKSLRQQQKILDELTKAGKANVKEDYFAFATVDRGITRWHHKKMPLTISTEADKSIKEKHAHLSELFMKACRCWEKKSNGAVKFKESHTPGKHAHIHVKFTNNPRHIGSIKQGETQTSYDLNGITNAKVKILTVDRNSGKEQGDELIYHTALHEIGHALGIDGHSPHPKDIMFFSETEEDWQKEKDLTGRDIQTLKLIYASKAAFIPPAGSKAEKEAAQIRAYNEHIKIYNQAVDAYNHGHFAEAIEKANEFLKLEPKSAAAKRLINGARKQMASTKTLNSNQE